MKDQQTILWLRIDQILNKPRQVWRVLVETIRDRISLDPDGIREFDQNHAEGVQVCSTGALTTFHFGGHEPRIPSCFESNVTGVEIVAPEVDEGDSVDRSVLFGANNNV